MRDFLTRSAWITIIALILISLTIAPAQAALNYAQSEIDGNGIDDDGDGYTDSEDTECGSHYEGYGSNSVGGQGGTVYWVDPLLGDPSVDAHAGTYADPCSLRKALGGSSRVIKFTRGGTITLLTDLVVKERNVTIDGFTCPAPGITITQNSSTHAGLQIESRENLYSHNWIINHIRFDGLWDQNEEHKVGWAIFGMSATRTNKKVHDIILDHLTIRDDQDKVTLWGNMANITVSNGLFHSSGKAFLISYYNATPDLLKTDISVTRNIFARNNERNPQLRGWIRNLDIVNNVMFDWDHKYSWAYGTRIKNEAAEKSVYANIINNYYEPLNPSSRALIYSWNPGWDSTENGPSSVLPQGTVYNGSDMGELWVSGNILPAGNMDHYSTISQAHSVPAWAQVTTIAADQAYTFVPQVGMQYPDSRDQGILDDVMAAIAPDTSVVAKHIFYNHSAFDGNDSAANAADDGAIATDKVALVSGASSFVNYTTYSKGINGIMVDATGTGGAASASDFTFKVGNDSTPAGWATAPAPTSVSIRTGDGDSSSDRITITFADGAIAGEWLEVTYIPTSEKFYFGNAIGETGNSITNAQVTPADEIGIRDNPHILGSNPAAVIDVYDFNRDKKVGPTDCVICRNNGTNSSTALQLITVP